MKWAIFIYLETLNNPKLNCFGINWGFKLIILTFFEKVKSLKFNLWFFLAVLNILVDLGMIMLLFLNVKPIITRF